MNSASDQFSPSQSSAAPSMPQPLSGLRVLDLTQFLSGPYATMILGDLGAEVIKIEPPGGELTRSIPPHFVAGDSAYFLSVNRSKQSLTLDLKQASGIALLRRLALECDIVVENFRPGVLNRLGLVYEELAAQKPELIWCSISGFGQTGPYRDHPAYDMIVQAMSGGMSMTGEPEGPPVRAGVPIGDLSAGLFSVIGVLAALNECRQTGKGKQIDIAMLDCQVSMLCYQAAYHLHSGVVPGRQGAAHDSIPTYRTFVAGDGVSVVVTANTERMWQDMAKVLGLADLLDDPRFANNHERFAHRHALWTLLNAAFLAASAEEWVARFKAVSIPVGVVNTLDHALTDPQVVHRQMVLELESDAGNTIRVAGNPIKFAGVKGREDYRYPPVLGSDTAQILQDLLKFSDAEITELALNGVIKLPDSQLTAKAGNSVTT
jgi:CoA:oxalate CoA-transferase